MSLAWFIRNCPIPCLYSILGIVLDLRQFTVLRAVDRAGSLAGAARALHYSQPTVTHHLDALESHLGAALVERTARGTVLTDLGRVFLPHAEAVLDRLESADREVRALARHGLATLRVGTFPTAGATVVPSAVARVHRETGVRVELLEAETPELLAALSTRALHAALVYREPGQHLELDEGFRTVHLLDDPFLVVLPGDHRAAAWAAVPLGALAEDPWIMSRQHDEPSDRALLVAAAAAGFTPRPVLRTDDYDVAFGFVAAGVGVALVPRMAVVHRLGVAVRPLAGSPLVRAVELARPATGGPPVVGLLEAALRTAVLGGAGAQPPAGDDAGPGAAMSS